MAPDSDQFYQEQYFKQIAAILSKQDEKLDKLTSDIATINANMKYIYGWAAGFAAVATFAVEFVISKLSKHV